MSYKAKKKIKSALIRLVILLIVFIDVYPLFWMITASFKAPGRICYQTRLCIKCRILPEKLCGAWTRGKMALFFKNSLICTVISLFLIIILTLTSSFALTKMRWKGRTFFDKYFAFGIMIPVATSLIPLFQIFQKMQLINTRTCLILVYTASGISFSIYLLQSYMKALPDEILEASV